ncbi:MAG: hypothetical protein NZM25_00565 [Leptospiraceae bacterium]|nr:hypothetical protein [Leptospiraceae bacterium]MDW8306217.1 hypothetical protein [Leptospiraceae bacterium]
MPEMIMILIIIIVEDIMEISELGSKRLFFANSSLYIYIPEQGRLLRISQVTWEALLEEYPECRSELGGWFDLMF